MPPTLTEERPTTEERVSRIEAVLPHLATKADVAGVRAEIAGVETRLITRIAEVETRLTKQIAESETRIVRWIIASVSLAVAVVTVINRVMG